MLVVLLLWVVSKVYVTFMHTFGYKESECRDHGSESKTRKFTYALYICGKQSSYYNFPKLTNNYPCNSLCNVSYFPQFTALLKLCFHWAVPKFIDNWSSMCACVYCLTWQYNSELLVEGNSLAGNKRHNSCYYLLVTLSARGDLGCTKTLAHINFLAHTLRTHIRTSFLSGQ